MCINLASNNADGNGKIMRQTCNSIRVLVCPVCGKNFIPAVKHLYKMKVGNKRKRVCSYTCARKSGWDG